MADYQLSYKSKCIFKALNDKILANIMIKQDRRSIYWKFQRKCWSKISNFIATVWNATWSQICAYHSFFSS